MLFSKTYAKFSKLYLDSGGDKICLLHCSFSFQIIVVISSLFQEKKYFSYKHVNGLKSTFDCAGLKAL